MFTNVVRVMEVDDCRWMETIPDTCYRNLQGWLICRTRGSHHGGRLIGNRFYVLTRLSDGKPWKLRSNKGQVRYFTTPIAAAHAASVHSQQTVEAWAKTKLVSELEDLTAKANKLRVEIEELVKQREARLGEVNRLNERKKHTAKGEVGPVGNSDIVSETDPGIMNNPPFLHRVTHVLRQVYKH